MATYYAVNQDFSQQSSHLSKKPSKMCCEKIVWVMSLTASKLKSLAFPRLFNTKVNRCLAFPRMFTVYVYRVTLVVEDLGWVDLDLGCSTILLGQ